jgi:hypothetical protein
MKAALDATVTSLMDLPRDRTAGAAMAPVFVDDCYRLACPMNLTDADQSRCQIKETSPPRSGPETGRLALATSPSGPERLTTSHRAWILPRSMLRLLVALLPTLFSAMRSRLDLAIENWA